MKWLQRGGGAPSREPVVSEEEQKKMMAYYYRKQEDWKVSSHFSMGNQCVLCEGFSGSRYYPLWGASDSGHHLRRMILIGWLAELETTF